MKKYKITLLRSQITFDFDNSKSLLQALEEQGIQPEYGCRTGFCGHCRTVAASGQWHYQDVPLAFIRSGQILLCCAIVDSDLELDL
ncbi:(2Fe-2S)-binding protein [Psittacicella melopsittaci]|uniref:(2Fe-2S)-binding protein n=1 Tax=Psittacicella melopsittaci TaxID=2028576 RepID=A0A3A1YCJ9_9GAMM|nr:class I ribonucleotide reductase maintenance protein YfaE [Psittacicella melopsittaci]RIY33944.1 (2Fe-2S)-binding protein [Psittacicella melopsittaci]